MLSIAISTAQLLLRIPAYISESAEEARTEPEASTMYVAGYSAAHVGSAPGQEAAERLRRLASISYSEMLRRKVMYGTSEEVVERIQRYKEGKRRSGQP